MEKIRSTLKWSPLDKDMITPGLVGIAHPWQKLLTLGIDINLKIAKSDHFFQGGFVKNTNWGWKFFSSCELYSWWPSIKIRQIDQPRLVFFNPALLTLGFRVKKMITPGISQILQRKPYDHPWTKKWSPLAQKLITLGNSASAKGDRMD